MVSIAILLSPYFYIKQNESIAFAADRPENCWTPGEAIITQENAPIYKRCITVNSEVGASMHFWNNAKDDTTTEGDDAEFDFVGATYFGATGEISPWVYRQKDDANYYIAFDTNHVPPSITLSHHFRSAQDKAWNPFSGVNQDYKNVSTYEPIDYDGSIPWVWRLVASGKVTVNGEPINIEGSNGEVKILLDSKEGPSITNNNLLSDGGIDFSRSAGGSGYAFASSNTVHKIVFYISLTYSGKKYQKYVETNFQADGGDWHTNDKDQYSKVYSLGTVDLTTTVDEFDREQGDAVGPIENITDDLGLGKCDIKLGFAAFDVPLCIILRGMWDNFIKPFSKVTLDILTGIVY